MEGPHHISKFASIQLLLSCLISRYECLIESYLVWNLCVTYLSENICLCYMIRESNKQAFKLYEFHNSVTCFKNLTHSVLTHCDRMRHICVGNLTIFASDNGLSPGRPQAIIRTNAGLLLIEPLGTNFGEILIEIHTFSIKKMHLKMAAGKWRSFCVGFSVLMAFVMLCHGT